MDTLTAVVILIECILVISTGCLGIGAVDGKEKMPEDGYMCMQWRHTKDIHSFAQTCAVYGAPHSLPYWELKCTWNVWTDCRGCGSPFHNCNESEAGVGKDVAKVRKTPISKPVREGNAIIQEAQANRSVGISDDNELCPCCIYGEPPYYDGPDFLAVEINPESGKICEETQYQFTLMGQWKTSHFDAPLSWCFWQTYRTY